MNRQFLFLAALYLALFFLIDSLHASSDVERHLRDKLQGKPLVLRDFYSGIYLHYDSSASPVGLPTPGNWMNDGFILVKDLRFSHRRLTIEAERLLVIERDGKEFQIPSEADPDRRKLRIEVDLNLETISLPQLDAAMEKIFLTAHDNLSALVSDYWKPCVLNAALGQDDTLQFAPELLTIPGVAVPKGTAAPPPTNEKRALDCTTVVRNKTGEGTPTTLYQVAPDYSDHARQEKLQGVVALQFVVNEQGIPTDIYVTKPLGLGLDEQAIDCLEKWRFKAAEKDGKPIATKMAVEINFHLY